LIKVFTPTHEMVAVSPGPMTVEKMQKLYVPLADHQAQCRHYYDEAIKLKREDYFHAKEAIRSRYAYTISQLNNKIKRMENAK